MQRLAGDELLRDLPLERGAVRAMLDHGFHPLKAQHHGSIQTLHAVHPEGRTPIDSGRMVIRVEHGKGGKDRYVMLSAQLLGILRIYWLLARPPCCLFPYRDETKPLDIHVLHAACRSAWAAAGLAKHVPLHTLRHGFATH